MKNKLYSALGALCVLATLVTFGPLTRKADAQAVARLNGAYAFQFNGNVFVGSPFDGPFYRNGLVVFDGAGNLQVTAVSNYGGVVDHSTYSGTYTVQQNSIFTIELPALSVPFLPPDVPRNFKFEGVIADNGKILKLALTDVSIGGQKLPNIGSVITGEAIRQN